MLNLQNAPTFHDIKAYVIYLKNNNLSEKLKDRCVDSLTKINMPYETWNAFDGTDGKDIHVPDFLKDKDYISWLKRSNDRLTTSEIALFLTHFSLWAHCCTINKPIVILEHDAIMLKPYYEHRFINTIHYLGSKDQLNTGSIPIWYFVENSYFFMPASHAYAIDPSAARNLLSHAIKYGITDPVDNFIRMDIFSVIQNDFYAYEEAGESTIKHNSEV